ncbi:MULTISPECIES: NAD(P)H-binding protein [Fictibacillus]|uniref:NAD(P)H-binding protein n=1 Tax=Fictibacillus TaxID=1329200 RepID=UPI00102A2E5B|nr:MULTISPECIES: NAD(P)H-binding protein [Fictibacillus]RZT14543.1 uncharacterized protein YbjT (DUF2867 family) [Fictibacillus sp. BK138]
MRVAVIGTSEAVGELVIKELKEKDHQPVAIIKEKNRKPDMEKLGASDVVIDEGNRLEKAFSACDAVIYIAGSSPRAGESKSVLVDHEEVIDSMTEAKRQGIERFVLMSAIRANEKDNNGTTRIGDKHKPDEQLKQEGFVFTIIRPGHLTDKPGKGMIRMGKSLDIDSEISKEDVASVLVESLNNESAFNKIFDVTSGNVPIHEAFNH